MIIRFFFLFFFLALSLDAAEDPTLLIERIYAHLIIHDPESAKEEAEKALSWHPHSQPLWKSYIKALAAGPNDQHLLSMWEKYAQLFPEDRENHDMIEWIAWSVIEKLSKSSAPLVRCMSLLAAFYAQDAQGVEIIHRALSDSNAIVRTIALELSPQLGDEKLKQALLVLFKTEKNWQVRLEVIRALGKMKVTDARPALLSILSGQVHSDEEKLSAIEALVCLYDHPSREEVVFLARSARAGLRQLACEVIAEYQLQNLQELIGPLLNDHHAEVRSAAIEACGILRAGHFGPILKERLQDPDYRVAIRAAWALAITEGQVGLDALRPWFKHDSLKVKLLASAALNLCGPFANPLNVRLFEQAQDPFVKMNLAIGLIGQRMSTHEACAALYQGFISDSQRWMWKEEGIFKMLAPSDVSYASQIPQYPEVLNQMTRLEVLNMLAILKYEKTEDAIVQYLEQKHWGVSAIASSLLLTEGDDSVLAIMENLLDHSNQAIKVQIALVLAQWGQEEKAIGILEEAYEGADADKKEKILEGLIQIASPQSIPFLLKCLHEPHATRKMIAALGLIRCIYH